MQVLRSKLIFKDLTKKFRQDEKTSAAITWQLAVIGEAVANLTRDLRNANPNIVWQKISGRETI